MPNRLNYSRCLCCMIILLSWLAACGGSKIPAEEAVGIDEALPLPPMPSTFANGEALIYIVGPLSGQHASKGLAIAAGAGLAADEINRQGGLLGRQLVVETINDGGDPLGATQAAQEILQRQQNGTPIVAVLVTEYSDPSLDMLSAFLTRDSTGDLTDMTLQALVISPVASGLESVTLNDPRFFRLTPPPHQQIAEIAAAMRMQGLTEIALVHSDDAEGEALASIFSKASQAQKLAINGSRAIDPFAISYREDVTQIQTANPASLFYAGSEESASRLLNELFGFEFQGAVFGMEHALTLNLVDELGCRANGMHVVSALPDPGSTFSPQQQQHYAQLNGQNMAAHSVAGYAAVEMLAQAYSAIGTLDAQDAAAYLHDKGASTRLGNLIFDANGNVIQGGVHFLQVDGGDLQPRFTRMVGTPIEAAQSAEMERRPLLKQTFTQEPLIFAGLNWESAALNNMIARLIVESAFGYPTYIDPGSSVPLFQKMRNGEIDIYMEAWFPNAQELYAKAMAARQIVDLGQNFDNAPQGWYIPRYLVEGSNAPATDLRSVSDLARYNHLFALPENPAMGRFLDGSPGWFSSTINCIKFKTYRLDDKYQQIMLGSESALFAELERAYANGEAVLAYLFEPTWPAAAFDLVRLEEPPYSEACWQNDKGCAYPLGQAKILGHSQLPAQAPQVALFLEKFSISVPELSRLLHKRKEDNLSIELLAIEWLQDNEAVWSPWIPQEKVSNVKAGIAIFNKELRETQ